MADASTEYAVSFKADPSILTDAPMFAALIRTRAEDACSGKGLRLARLPTYDIVPPDITRAIPPDQLGDDPTFREISSSWPTIVVRFYAAPLPTTMVGD